MFSNVRSDGILSLPPLADLPKDILANIGLVIVKHSNMENLLQRICYLLAGVDDVVGRIAMREPRTSDRLTMLEDLAAHQGIKLDEALMKLLHKDIPVVTKARDTLAHGLFFEHPETGQIMVRDLGGTWQPPGTIKGRAKRRVRPSAPKVNASDVFEFSQVIAAINQALVNIHAQVTAQLLAPPPEHPASSPRPSPRPKQRSDEDAP